jgi:hypothetical protein
MRLEEGMTVTPKRMEVYGTQGKDFGSAPCSMFR